jgi:predicted dehydrogenase
MGKRRIRDLLALGIQQVVGVDLNPERRAETNRLFGIETRANAESALSAVKCDAVVISTPPDLHTIYGEVSVKAGIPFFMEANVVQTGLAELAELCKTHRILAAPSCSMRFHPSVKVIKQFVEQVTPQEIAAFSYVSGQYLPDWHPWEDYRQFYVANKETGACREIVPFELNWLTWLFGDVITINTVKAKRTRIEVDIEDIYLLSLTFQTGVVGSLEVNVISRIPERAFRAIGEKHYLIWNWMDQQVQIYDAVADSWRINREAPGFKNYNLETMYFDEMQNFVKAVRGECEYGFSIEEELKILDTLSRAERTATQPKPG